MNDARTRYFITRVADEPEIEVSESVYRRTTDAAGFREELYPERAVPRQKETR